MAKIQKLKRTLGLPVLVLYGLGNILGAGIYVLVGKVAGEAGSGTSLAFILAMITASFTAFAYMELASRYPVSASISVYLYKAFNRKWLSVLIGMLMVGGGITSAAALAQGFGGYLSSLTSLPILLSSILLILVLGFITLKGIGESAKTAAIFTIVEILGLLLIIWVGKNTFTTEGLSNVISIDPALGLSGLFAGAFLAFYAFIGFEDMVNVAEEVKKPRLNMPLAIITALFVATVLYLLVVYVATNTVSTQELANSNAPLALVLEKSGGNYVSVLSLIGIAAAINGVIVQIIMCSRILYGLSKQGWITPKLSKLHGKYSTPVVATTLVLVLMIIGTALLPLVFLAQITSLLILVIFSLVNISLIIIKKISNKKSKISIPIVFPYLGAAICICAVIYQILSWIL
jgi:APA family basic amino acid/polyamine antiporter